MLLMILSFTVGMLSIKPFQLSAILKPVAFSKNDDTARCVDGFHFIQYQIYFQRFPLKVHFISYKIIQFKPSSSCSYIFTSRSQKSVPEKNKLTDLHVKFASAGNISYLNGNELGEKDIQLDLDSAIEREVSRTEFEYFDEFFRDGN